MTDRRHVTIGQFSDSAIIHAIRHLGLDEEAGLGIEVRAVPSSPAQFTWLRDGDIDIAITSPDNVLLYATTDQQPLGERLDVRILRPIDRGLGLALFCAPGIDAPSDLRGADIGVDVERSGFALLLKKMLSSLGLAPTDVSFVELGSTPKRLTALSQSTVAATILNAESRVEAIALGLTPLLDSTDVAESYLGTVLATRADFDFELSATLTQIWTRATQWLKQTSTTTVCDVLGKANPRLNSEGYVELLHNPGFGLVESTTIDPHDLDILCDIRREFGAYAPDTAATHALARG